jgi:hypothetical protein
VLVLLLAVLVVSCGTNSTQNSPPETKVAPPSPTASAAPANTPPQDSKQYALPDVQSFLQDTVWRESDNAGDDGDLPPWKKVSLDARFDEKPKVDGKVTVVPLQVTIAPVELKILKVTEEEKPCQKKPRSRWAVELEPITQKEFFEIKAISGRREEYPFDACVIYPAVEFARQLKPPQLTKEMIPEGVSLNTVTAAIDLTNDQQPDLLIAYYCCRDTTKMADSDDSADCDYTCGKLFKRTKDGWKLVEEQQPC